MYHKVCKLFYCFTKIDIESSKFLHSNSPFKKIKIKGKKNDANINRLKASLKQNENEKCKENDNGLTLIASKDQRNLSSVQSINIMFIVPRETFSSLK